MCVFMSVCISTYEEMVDFAESSKKEEICVWVHIYFKVINSYMSVCIYNYEHKKTTTSDMQNHQT